MSSQWWQTYSAEYRYMVTEKDTGNVTQLSKSTTADQLIKIKCLSDHKLKNGFNLSK